MNTNSTPFLTSEYLEKMGKFYKEKKSKLQVLVEDNDDVKFWKRLFACIEHEYLSVDVITLKQASASARERVDENGNPLSASGKDALMKVAHLGKYKVVAIDADYDLLMDYHNYSNRVREDKYVIHTEYYAIENHLLDIHVLPNLSLWHTEVNPYLDTIPWFEICEAFGNAMKDAVKLSIVSHKKREICYQANPEDKALPNCLDVKAIKEAFDSIPNFNPEGFQQSLNETKDSLDSNPNNQQIRENCAQELQVYDSWTWKDGYHHVQGHTLYGFMSKVIGYYFQRAYTNLENAKKTDVPSTEIPKVIVDLKSRLGVSNGNAELIKGSVFSADALDMTDTSICTIQNNIRKILN